MANLALNLVAAEDNKPLSQQEKVVCLIEGSDGEIAGGAGAGVARLAGGNENSAGREQLVEFFPEIIGQLDLRTHRRHGVSTGVATIETEHAPRVHF